MYIGICSKEGSQIKNKANHSKWKSRHYTQDPRRKWALRSRQIGDCKFGFVTSGTNSVNLQANNALENAGGILKDVRVDEEVLKIISSKQNENLVDYNQVPSYQYEPSVQLSGNENFRQSKQVKPEEELTSASLEKIILPPPVD